MKIKTLHLPTFNKTFKPFHHFFNFFSVIILIKYGSPKLIISKIRNSGAFVELPGNIIGFIPLAELSGQTPQEALVAGQEYDMAILNIDAKEHKLTLTLDKKE